MKLRAFFSLMAAFAIPVLLRAADPPANPGQAKRPNILLILADDLGYGELSIQGNPQIPTPNIDSLARNGIRFTSGYVSGPYCSPTRAALMTGRYQQRYGHEFNPGPAQASSPNFGLSLKEKTIADRLKAGGYVSGWFGKSHLGYLPQYHPLKRGFDEYYGFLGGQHDYLDAAADGHNPILRGTNIVNNVDYTTDAFGREAVAFIEKHRSQPWFVYLAFNAVHAPLESTTKYLGRFENINDRKRRTFAAMLSAMDDAVGSVLEKIHELGQDEDTLIFFLSDNGGPTAQTTSGNGPLRGFKAQTWEGGIRIPFIIQWKGHLPAGQVDDRPVIQLDILPTALAAAGLEIQPDWKLDGVNLIQYLSGSNSKPPHEALYWRFGGQMAIRKGDWKLVKAPGLAAGQAALRGKANTAGAELYNLARDIGEKTDLASDNAGKVAELASAWDAWNAGLVDPAWGGQGRAGAGAVSATGPWKGGDVVRPARAPQIAGRALLVTAEVELDGQDGAIIAQGGSGNGYALFIRDGKPSFALRSARELAIVSAKEAPGNGHFKIQAKLAEDGKITLSIDGKVVAEGEAKTLISNQPARGLFVGRDPAPVGDYKAPYEFKGRIESVSLSFP